MSLIVANGYARRALWLDAWEAVESAAEADRIKPEAMYLRLRCCTHLDLWVMGSVVASLLVGGSEEDREEAVSFYLALAQHEMAKGNPDLARNALVKAVNAWPVKRSEVLQQS